MKRLKIGFDLDGVLYPWHLYVWKDLYNRGVIDFTFHHFWSKAWKELDDSLWKKVIADPILYMNDYYDDAVKVVKKINKVYDIYYLTKRPDNVKIITYNSLCNYGFPECDKLHFLGNHEDAKKSYWVEKLNTDYYVEDRAEYIEDLLSYTKVVAVKQPYNEDYLSKNPNILKINNIIELPKVLGL